MSGGESIRLILVRHGNTFEASQTPTQVGSRTDMPLTTQGRLQAQQFADYLASKGIEPKAIYAGTLRRQTESAKIIGNSLKMEKLIHLDEPALTEIDYGPWEGLTSEAISSQWTKEYADWTEQSRWVEGVFGKSLKEHLNDIEKWLEKLRRIYSGGDVVVGVTSNGIIRFFHSLQMDRWEALVKDRQMEDLKVKTGHFCELLLTKNALEVVSWNVKPLA